MSWLLLLCGLGFVAGLIALNLQVPLRWSGRVRKLGYRVLGWLHNRSEAAVFTREPTAAGAPAASKSPFRQLIANRLGIWSLISSFLFVAIWVSGWVSPTYTLGFLAHLAGSWIGGLLLASLGFGAVWAVGSSWQMGLAQLYASRSGLRRIWMANSNLSGTRLPEALHQAAAAAQRIDILDFTGYELLAKGTSAEEGGVLAKLLAWHPEKEARVLLFNPSVQEIDPDRKQTTVLQSQLGAMEMSREAFESKLRATFDRIEALNQKRQKPIEVRLYSEKPSFRAVVVGDSSFLGAIDAHDATGELLLYEAWRKADGPSMYTAARSHFLRVWGDSLPVLVEAASTIEEEAPVAHESPVPRTRAGAR